MLKLNFTWIGTLLFNEVFLIASDKLKNPLLRCVDHAESLMIGMQTETSFFWYITRKPCFLHCCLALCGISCDYMCGITGHKKAIDVKNSVLVHL